VRLTVADRRLIVEAGGTDRRVSQLHLTLPSQVLDSLGWQSGDVVGIEAGSGRLEVHKVPSPTDSRLTTVGEDGIPVPPHWLVQMVTGAPTTKDFVERSHVVAKVLADLIKHYLPAVESPVVIDFGCGCGRVARALPQHVDCELWGCDITAPAVEWCQEYLPGTYFMSTEEPPLKVADEQFDSLYAISVLTHLDEPHQDAWLAEWGRIVKPGGLLLVTYRGEGFLSKLEPPRRQKFEELWEPHGMGFTTTDFWEGLFPPYYGGAYHKDAYVREHWGRFFDVLALHTPKDTGLVQDLAVLRRPGA
jgi:SAM-dependent methyltransferase